MRRSNFCFFSLYLILCFFSFAHAGLEQLRRLQRLTLTELRMPQERNVFSSHELFEACPGFSETVRCIDEHASKLLEEGETTPEQKRRKRRPLLNVLNGRLYELEAAMLIHDYDPIIGFNLILWITHHGRKLREEVEYDLITQQWIIECKSICSWKSKRMQEKYRRQWLRQQKILRWIRNHRKQLLDALEKGNISEEHGYAQVKTKQFSIASNWITETNTEVVERWKVLLGYLSCNFAVCSKFKMPESLVNFLKEHHIHHYGLTVYK